jgi:hypothetical protein
MTHRTGPSRSNKFTGAPCDAEPRVYTGASKRAQQSKMFARLPKRLRLQAALFIAALYALCVVAPTLALAFTDGAGAAHCFTDDHHNVAGDNEHGTHIHHDGDSPDKSNHHGKQNSENCCGLFCITSGAVPLVPELAGPNHANAMALIFDDAVLGHPSDRIDRPPRSFLSL